MHQYTKTNYSLLQQAEKVLPGGVNSPIRAWKNVGGRPFVPAQGKQDTIIDIEGNQYIDYCMSFGALILGHAANTVCSAANSAISKGSTFGLTTKIELEIAQWITKHTFCDQLRFVSSGTEALSTIIRLARGYTKKPWIVKFAGNYHGHIDSLLEQSGSYAANILTNLRSCGITKNTTHHTISLPYNDIQAAELLFSKKEFANNIALVLLEPIAANMGVVPASKQFLQYLRRKTETMGALLCFDEVISGFRIGLQGAVGLYNIVPDLVAYGKIVGGGFPAACVGGKKNIMQCLAPQGNVFQAGTLSGNPVALHAGYEVLQQLSTPNFYQQLEEKSSFLLDPIEKFLENTEHSLHRVGSMFSLFFAEKQPNTKPEFSQKSREIFSRFFHYLLKKGIYFSPACTEAQFISIAHNQSNLEKTRNVILQAIEDCSFVRKGDPS